MYTIYLIRKNDYTKNEFFSHYFHKPELPPRDKHFSVYPSETFLADIWPDSTAGACHCWEADTVSVVEAVWQPPGTAGGTRMTMLRVTEMVKMEKKQKAEVKPKVTISEKRKITEDKKIE